MPKTEVREFARSAVLSAMTPLLMVAGTARAAEPQAQNVGVAEVVITAQRREESIQRAPLAVVAFTQEGLTSQGVRDLNDLNSVVPGVNISSHVRESAITIRGVGSRLVEPGTQTSVSTYLDGIFLARPSSVGGAFYDMERVEILKGPQGTLYGRNSTGGAINYITAKPRLTEFESSLDATVGNLSLVSAQGMVNVPVADTFAIRAAAYYNERDGYLHNPVASAAGLATDLASVNTAAARLHMLWQPHDRLRMLLSGDYFADDGDGANNVDLTVNRGNYVQATNTPFQKHNRGRGLAADITFDAGAFDPTSITGYRSDVIRAQYDADFTGDPTLFRANTFHNPSKTFSQEIRATSAGEGPWRYVAGLFYYRQREKHDFDLYPTGYTATPPATTVPVIFQRTSDIATESRSVFGQTTYSVTDRFRVTGGVRYTNDEITDPGTRRYNFNVAPGTAPALPGAASATFPAVAFDGDKVTWRAGIELDPRPGTLLFVNAGTGFKGGGISVTQNNLQNKTFEPENMTAYEIGIKNTLADGRAILNLNAFHYDYEDIQVTAYNQVLGNTTSFVLNAASAQFDGVELEGRYRSGSLGLDGFAAYTRAEYDRFTNAFDQFNPQYAFDLSGRPLPYNAKWNASLGVEYAFGLGGGTLTPRISTRYQSRMTFMPFGTESYSGTALLPTTVPQTFTVTNSRYQNQYQKAFTQTRVQLRYDSPGDRYYAMAFVDNLEDEFYLYGTFISIFGDFGFVAPPRTYGLTFGMRL